jgi:hypothetical protein
MAKTISRIFGHLAKKLEENASDRVARILAILEPVT